MAVALVTGASGFIGSHLVEALVQRGDDVRCLVRASSSRTFLQSLGASFVEGDVTCPDTLARAVNGVDVVYNLAGLTSALSAADQARVNISGVEHLAGACAARPDPPVHVLISSVAAAGPAPRHRLRVEADPLRPVSRYGHSKRDGELAAQRFADRVPTTIVRPGAVFGQRDRLMLPMFKLVARFHVHAAAGLFPPKLSVIYVKDLVQLLLAAADRGERLPGFKSKGNALNDNGANTTDAARREFGRGCYFACASEYPDVMQFGRLLAVALDTRFVIYLPMPQPIPWFVGGLGELGGRLLGRAAPLNIDKMREATVSSWACSVEKAQVQLDFEPSQPLVEHLRETAQWYRREGWV